MKKIIAVIAAFCCFMGLNAQGSKDDGELITRQKDVESGKLIKVTGVVKMYGNMPFAYPGIESIDGKKYSLVSGDSKLLKKVRECAGKEIVISGFINLPADENVKGFQMLKDGYLYVEGFELVKRSRKKKI